MYSIYVPYQRAVINMIAIMNVHKAYALLIAHTFPMIYLLVQKHCVTQDEV